MISVKKEELICGIDEGSDEGEPKLEIASAPENLTTSNRDDYHPNPMGVNNGSSSTNQEVVESLLMLGRQAVVGPEALQRQRAASMSSVAELQSDIPIRRHSSSSESRVPPSHDKGAVVSYYQRMRERNNEASKRCRLKRRMKAVSMENQASMLQVANKQLRARIQRLENVGAALKEGVKKIQVGGQCDLTAIAGLVRQNSRDFFDPEPGTGRDLPSYEMISRSRLVREQEMPPGYSGGQNSPTNGLNGGSVGYTASTGTASSEEENVVVNPTSPPVQVQVPTVVQQSLNPALSQTRTKTALDVINETIVKTLDSPLNLVKSQPQSQQVILISQSPRPSVDSIASSAGDSSSIKIEPVEATKADSTVVSCIANANGASICRGEMLNLNKLTCYLDLITRKVVRDDGSSAMERAIIKSRLKIPFWSADETALFICGSHRTSIVQAMDLNCCALCNRRRTPKKARQMAMYTITYSMSLEYYTRNGHILPIGLAVCGICKEKHLKSVDFSNSRTIPIPDPEPIILPDSSYKRDQNQQVLKPMVKTEMISIYPSPPKKVRQMSTSVSSTNDVIVASVSNPGYNSTTDIPSSSHKTTTTIVPVSNNSGNNSNIFAKIGRLNEALQAINPRYQPIGFSITSMDSCSPGVLQDALVAAETGVFTILSVIAPGQETQLWEAIRPTLDKKLKK